jgi:hypothetical protein
MNCGRIVNWGMGGERASKTAYYTDKLYCDMISTQIPNWIQSTEFAKLRLCSMIYLAKKQLVCVRSGYQPRQERASQVLLGPAQNRTAYPVQTRAAGGLPEPVATTNLR